jgi:hypothetical protein
VGRATVGCYYFAILRRCAISRYFAVDFAGLGANILALALL